jgi:hypothetical protein
MTKSFMYSIWSLSFFIFLLAALYCFFGLFLYPFYSGGELSGNFSWVNILGMIVSSIVIFPVYRLIRLRKKISQGIEGKKFITTIVLLYLILLIPIAYKVQLNSL